MIQPFRRRALRARLACGSTTLPLSGAAPRPEANVPTQLRAWMAGRPHELRMGTIH